MLIQNLPLKPLDIVGDVHGQFEAFQNLLHYLGYSPDGWHPKGRQLVFVGDLIDRGPDSPSMLDWFIQAQERYGAMMVLGNHELNILNNEPKDGTGWFFHHRADKDAPNYAPWQMASHSQKQRYLHALVQQPLILQRHDIRIVHAAWQPESVEALAKNNQRNIVELCQEWDESLRDAIQHASWFDDYLAEQRLYAHQLENPNQTLPALPATIQHDIFRSQKHPIRALTCGTEEISPLPFFSGGRWRFTIRQSWWNHYHDSKHIVIGHYWRQWGDTPPPKHRANLFNVPAQHWLGARKNVFCIDFSVGARWRDRKHRILPRDSKHRLAALRWPEQTLVFDNGDTEKTL